MFMGILSQTVSIAKGLCFVTSQLKLLLGIWEVKERVTKKIFFCFNTDIQERRRILPKDPEEMELLPGKPGRGASKRGEIADVSLCAALPTSLAWHDFLICACGFFRGSIFHSLSGVP